MLPSDGVKPGAESLIRGILEVHLKMNHDTNTLTMGLTAKACLNRTCIFNKPVFNNTEIPGEIPYYRFLQYLMPIAARRDDANTFRFLPNRKIVVRDDDHI